jgi:hypothetical protein
LRRSASSGETAGVAVASGAGVGVAGGGVGVAAFAIVLLSHFLRLITQSA